MTMIATGIESVKSCNNNSTITYLTYKIVVVIDPCFFSAFSK